MQEKIYLRRANIDDMLLLFDWANEAAVRQNSFNTNKISIEEHKAWMERILADMDTKLFILQKNDSSVGQVRLAFNDDRWQISYSIAPTCRGQGYGKKILQLAEKELIRGGHAGDKLYAEVKQDNIASQLIFKKLGYSETASQHDNAYAYTKVVAKENKNGIE